MAVGDVAGEVARILNPINFSPTDIELHWELEKLAEVVLKIRNILTVGLFGKSAINVDHVLAWFPCPWHWTWKIGDQPPIARAPAMVRGAPIPYSSIPSTLGKFVAVATSSSSPYSYHLSVTTPTHPSDFSVVFIASPLFVFAVELVPS